MIVLSNSDVAELMSMQQAIKVVGRAMLEVSAGKTTLPLRSIMPVGGDNFMGMMPGSMDNPPCFGVKLVSLFPDNPASGHSSHQGAMVLFEAEHGSAIAMMNADLLTAVRTAAASGVATRELARPNSTRLTIVGYGEQARHHLDAMMVVRPISDVIITGRNSDRIQSFINSAQSRYKHLRFTGTASVKEAVQNADIICTVTTSSEPVLLGNWVNRGCHLNIVGASIPSKREINADLVEKSSVFVDYRVSALAQAGEIIGAIDEGRISAEHIKAEIGEVLAGKTPGRGDDNEITLYRSLGIAAQDIVVAFGIAASARKLGKGANVTLD